MVWTLKSTLAIRAASIMSSRISFLKILHRAGGLGLPQDHVVVVLDGLDMGQARENRLRAAAVARVVVDLDAAEGDLEVGREKVWFT